MSKENGETKVYPQRWYILLSFSLFSMVSCAIWNTFGPVASSVEKVYGWTESTLSLFTLWGCVDFILFFLPSAYLLSRSLRWSVVVGTSCMLASSILRCVALYVWSSSFTVVCHMVAVINAIAGPIAMGAPIQISSAWFPPHERTRATSIGQMFNPLGVGFSFFLGVVTVREEDDVNIMEKNIETLLWTYTAMAFITSVLIYCYFPSQPPTPPSVSASEQRLDFTKGFLILMKNKNGWIVLLTYSISQGVVQGWQSMMVANLTSLSSVTLSQSFVSTLGIVIVLVAVFVSIVFATGIDYFRKKMRIAIIFLLLCSGILFIFVTLITEEYITFENETNFKIVLCFLLISGTSFACAAAPIAFEFCVELCYPVAEGTIGSWLVVWFMVWNGLFFLVFQVPGSGTRWLNYALAPAVLLPIPLLLTMKEEYKRSEIDG